MSYHYSDPGRETEVHALPNVEVFEATGYQCSDCDEITLDDPTGVFSCATCGSVCGGLIDGWFFAYGFPGCLRDSDPLGPYDTEEEALTAMREES